jgi:hypothetical protein
MTTDNEQPRRLPPSIRAGGGVLAIIPQDIEQVWRLAGIAWQGGMAPKSLVDKKTPEEAQAACAIAIMAGAELGLTPMMALRSYAVVNGRPSLWGDGIKAVVRQSGKCEFIKTGSDQTKGWCEAKRKDTGETKRVEFTIEQAKAANLTTKDGPWKQGYADVMMERRATNRCLNDLFADVLGGIASAEEAYEDGPMPDEPRQIQQRPTPPEPPADDEPETTTTEGGKVIEGTAVTIPTDPLEEGRPIQNEGTEFDPAKFLTELDEELTLAADKDTLLEIWERFDAPTALDGTAFAEDADKIYARHESRIEKRQLEAAGQGTMFAEDDDTFPGDRK